MYKLMLVEDESIVRESMIQNIDWEQYGFQLICACENGQEALDSLATTLPDVVVTDICMPYVDGLELARHLHENYPSVYVVILTGFSEFSYAQQAVKLHVHDFVLKPVVPREFCALLQKLADDLDARDSKRSNLRSLQSRAYQAETMMRNALFRNLFRGPVTSDEIRSAAREAGLTLDCPAYSALFCQPQHVVQSVAEIQHLQDAAQKTASRFRHCTAASLDDNCVALLTGGRTQDEAAQRARDAAVMLADAVAAVSGVPAQVGIGTCCSDLSGLHRCFREAYHALGYGLTASQRVILDHQARAMEQTVTQENPLPGTKGLVQGIADGQKAALEQLDALFDTMERRRLHRSACVPTLEHLRFSLMELVGPESAHAVPQISTSEHWFQLSQVREEFRQLAVYLVRAANAKTQEEDPARRCVESAKNYILQHYYDSNFSLTELLSLLNVSKSYFSSAFKVQTGQTFVEYLTEVRMKKAMQLLTTTNLCTYEIAERIGFTDPHYFSVSFKRFTGKTPRAYREDPQ